MSEVVLFEPPYKADEEPAAYEIKFEPAPKQVRVVFADHVVAKSENAMVLRETRLAPVHYLPAEDVDERYLEASEHRTYCPFKGTARYWHLVVGERKSENAVWSYDEPLQEAASVAGYMAFYSNRVDALCEADKEVSIGPGGNSEIPNPLVDWVLREAWEAVEAEELVARFARRIVGAQIPLFRMNILLGTLNPMLLGNAYVWRREDERVQEMRLLHERRDAPAFKESPLIPIYEGRGGVRRRLEGPHADLDFPILHELKAEGVTDYVALPLHFSDGHINVLTLATDQPGGFTTAHLGQIYEVLPLLSRLFEVHALKRTTKSLMTTYLGAHTADLVLGGRIKRGDGENIPAVIFYADLRDSTRMAANLGRDEYLKILNAFFEAVAGAVLEEDGEVLKFIGDAVLAIFPITGSKIETENACRRAITASENATARVSALNNQTESDGAQNEPLAWEVRGGVALHKGEVTYGNVGSQQRLDFTVIGQAANETARIADLCKELKQAILFSSAVAKYLERDVASLGRYSLRGIPDSHEIFTLLDDTNPELG